MEMAVYHSAASAQVDGPLNLFLSLCCNMMQRVHMWQ